MGLIDSLLIALKFKVDDSPVEGAKAKLKEVEHQAERTAVKVRGALSGGAVGAQGTGTEESILAARSTLLAMGAAAVGAGAGLFHLAHSAMESMDDVKDFAEVTGMAATEVEQLGKLAYLNDSSLQEMMGTIQSVTIATGQAAMGFGRAKKAFEVFGLSAKNADGSVKGFDEMMDQVADKVDGMDLPSARALGSRLGISPQILKLLIQGKEAWRAQREEIRKTFPFTEAQYEEASKADLAWKKMKSSIGFTAKVLGAALIPKLTEVVKKITKWVGNSENIDKIKKAVNQVTAAIGFLLKHLDLILYGVGALYTYKLAGWFLSVAPAALKVLSIFKDWHGAIGMLKTILTGALLVALGLVIEDLWIFYQGGDSITGLLVNKLPNGFNVVIMSLGLLGSALMALTMKSGPLGLFLTGLMGIVLAVKEIKDSWNVLGQYFDEWFSKYSKVLTMAKVVMLPVTGMATAAKAGYNFLEGKLAKPEQAAEWAPNQAAFNEAGGMSKTSVTFGDVNISLPNAKDTKEGAREAWKDLNRLATGGVKG